MKKHSDDITVDAVILATDDAMAQFISDLLLKDGKAKNPSYETRDSMSGCIASVASIFDIWDNENGKIYIGLDTIRTDTDIDFIISMLRDAANVRFIAFEPGFGCIFDGNRELMDAYIQGVRVAPTDNVKKARITFRNWDDENLDT